MGKVISFTCLNKCKLYYFQKIDFIQKILHDLFRLVNFWENSRKFRRVQFIVRTYSLFLFFLSRFG